MTMAGAAEMGMRRGRPQACPPGAGARTSRRAHAPAFAAALLRDAAWILIPAIALLPLAAEERPGDVLAEAWDYAPTIQAIAAHFTGEAGKVVPMGDSITYANPAGSWARSGVGRSADELSLARWMHAEVDGPRNGWWLAANDQPDNRSWTAASGITAAEYLAGGYHGLPSLAAILSAHKPQLALILLGTNDAKHGNAPASYLAAMERIMRSCMAAGAVPVVTTLPPTSWAAADALAAYNDGLYRLAERLRLPLLDLHGEFLRLRPGESWKGTLISADGAHPTATPSVGPASADNLASCGYLAKCYLQCRKVGEIKAKMAW